MKLLKDYNKTIKKIYEYFDYTSGDSIYPIEDYTDYFWKITDSIIYYSDDDVNLDMDFIEDEFLESCDGDDYVMFLIKDSLNLDNNCLMIFEKLRE